MKDSLMDGFSRHIHNEMLHFMKTTSFEKYYNTELIKNSQKWCPFTHEDKPVDYQCYRTNPAIEVLLSMLDKYQLCNHFLDSNRYFLDEYSRIVTGLHHPETINNYDYFENQLSTLSVAINRLDSSVQECLNRLCCIECQRLDECLINYSNHSQYSSIIMAVSAVEFRLHWMVRKLDDKRYEKEFEDATLGQIIYQVSDKGKYDDIKKLLQPTHIPLIQLLNKYRILSVHPKVQQIPQGIVNSIVSLSFSFLTDPENSVYTPEEARCPLAGEKPKKNKKRKGSKKK
jgi:hypothetical protein